MNKKSNLILIIGIIIIAISLVTCITAINNEKNSSDSENGKLIVDGESINKDKMDYSTNESDTNTVLVQNGGKLKLTNSKITKTGSSSNSNSDSTPNPNSNSNSTPNSNEVPDKPDGEGNNLTESVGAKGEGGGNNAPENNVGNNAPENNGGNNAPENNVGNNAPENNGGNNAPEKNGGGSNSEDSEFYGTNAAILTLYDSITNISDCTIETNADGANAIFATNNDSSHSGATTYVENVEINTYQDKSRGLDATYGGTIIAKNVKINTRGGSCAALATDRGEGIVNATNCELNTGINQSGGSGSPCIYSTGSITAVKCTGTSNVAQIGCIEGKNSITLIDSDLTGYAQGNRQSNGEYVDLGGVFIYQSMSGDADEGTSIFNSTNTKLSISSESNYYETAPMFHITNTKANITLDSTTLNFGSDVLLNASGQDQWGTSGSNGGEVQFKAIKEDLTGNIIIDEISSLNFELSNSKYSGAINPSDSYGNTNVTIGSDASWTLTGDSHISDLDNQGTINYGEYSLFINGKEYNSSNPYKG